MTVYLFTTEILISSTIAMPVHVAFYVEIYDIILDDFGERKQMQTFCNITWPRNIKTSISISPLETSWSLLQNLSNRDFQAQFLWKLCRNEHSWEKLGGENRKRKVSIQIFTEYAAFFQNYRHQKGDDSISKSYAQNFEYLAYLDLFLLWRMGGYLLISSSSFVHFQYTSLQQTTVDSAKMREHTHLFPLRSI